MNFYNMRFTAERAVKLLFKLFLEILDEQKVENEENQKNLENILDIGLIVSEHND